ncbi:flagellar hook-associated protein 2 [Collibacillus ludicampi]|uniref:Flagellar hook-associated protein 2 n=1 Tax=Collibacillus ludicampi TaxID=2771369 RepID=A0AAV4LCV1_9BACL|nr:flagellar filament capping protein FliD [Collibacillus ludicampi]GIM45498.1 flagellar hook-associated protein 2 [Collibacillus ludicampi]
MGINSMQLLTQMMGGIDTNSIIQQLDYINRQAIYQPGGLNDQLSKIQQQQTDWRNVNNSALTLQNLLQTLASSTTFGSFTATPADTTILSASAGTGAAPGTYTINVTGIGSNATLTSGGRIGQLISGTDSVTATKFSAAITTGNFAVTKGGQTQYIAVNSTDTIQDVLNRISSAFGGTVSGTVNGSGQIVITTTDNQQMTFGSAGDTSNFAHVLGLDVAQQSGSGPYTYTTTAQGQVQLGQAVGSAAANFGTAVTSTTTGDFKINNIDITYDTTKDSLSVILNRINTSNAGVTASYDPINDKVILTSKSSQPVTVQDVTGNLMHALQLDTASGAVSTAGSNWTFSVNGTLMTSVSSAVTNVIPGVTVNLLKTGQTTLTISSNTSQAVTAVQNFVSQFNSLYNMIGNLIGKDGDLQGDATLASFQANIRDAVTGPITQTMDNSGNTVPLPNYPQNSLMGIGISTGAIGSPVGTTNSLTVDTNKLTAALQQNPAMVRDLITGMALKLNQVLTNMTGMVNTLNGSSVNVSQLTGISTSQDQLYQNMIKDLQDQIQQVNDMADQQKQLLIAQFTAMNEAISQSHMQGNALLGFLGH